MRNQILVSAGVAAAVSLLMALLLQPGTSTTSTAAGGGETEAELTKRVVELEAELSALESKLGVPVKRRRATPPSDDEWDRIMEKAVAAADGQQDTAQGSNGTSSTPDFEDNPEARERVGQVVREEMEAAREERFERRFERHAERRTEMVENFSSAQGLDGATQARLQELMMVEHEQIADLFRQAREDGTWHEARDEARGVREDTDEAISGVLDEDQMEAWTTEREEARASRRH